MKTPRRLERCYLHHLRHFRRKFLPLLGKKTLTGRTIDRTFVKRISMDGAVYALRMEAKFDGFCTFRFEVDHE